MPAKDKAALIDITQKEYAKLAKLVAGIDAATALRKRDEDTSIKDVIAHRAHWIDLYLGWYRDGQAARDVHIPAKGYRWNELKAYNAVLRRAQADMGWEAAVTELAAAKTRLLTHLNALSTAAL